MLFYGYKRECFVGFFIFEFIWLILYRYDLNKELGKFLIGKENIICGYRIKKKIIILRFYYGE